MIEVAGMWEIGWNTPIMEADLWEMTLREFGLTALSMTPISGINKPWIDEYEYLDDILTAKPDLTPVFVDELGEVELSDFVHPENALYVFGKTTHSPFNSMAKKYNAQSVRIASVNPATMWAHQALAIVLYDRAKQ
mgnify:CR=1 FL=1